MWGRVMQGMVFSPKARRGNGLFPIPLSAHALLLLFPVSGSGAAGRTKTKSLSRRLWQSSCHASSTCTLSATALRPLMLAAGFTTTDYTARDTVFQISWELPSGAFYFVSNSLVRGDISGRTKLPLWFVVLSRGELRLIWPELSLNFP